MDSRTEKQRHRQDTWTDEEISSKQTETDADCQTKIQTELSPKQR